MHFCQAITLFLIKHVHSSQTNEELASVPTDKILPSAAVNQEQSAIDQYSGAAKELESSLVTNHAHTKFDNNIKLINEMDKGDKNKKIK